MDKKRRLLDALTDHQYRARMVKGKKGWLIKGLVIGAVSLGGLMISNTSSTYAAEWVPNSVEQIAQRIQPGQTSLTFEWGDTVWNIGLALNIKDPMQLLYDNGFKNGEQYTIQVGTVISWDGNHVTVTSASGEVIGESIITPEQKHDPARTVANQASDTPQKLTTTAQEKPATGQGSQVPPAPNKPGTSNEATNPTTPEKPETPVNPETPENLTELQRLKKLLAELQIALAAEKESLAENQALLAQLQQTPNKETIQQQIDEVTSLIAEKDQQRSESQEQLAVLQESIEAAQESVATSENTLAAYYDQQKQAEEAVNAARSAYNAIKEAGDAQQIENAEAALNTANSAYQEISGAVSSAENDVAEKQAILESVQQQLPAKAQEIQQLDTTAEQERLSQLQQQLELLPEVTIAEVQEKIAASEAKIQDLEKQIDETIKKIADIELKVARQETVGQINQLAFLSQDQKSDYTNQINTALSQEILDAILMNAVSVNEAEKAKWEAEEAAKQLAAHKQTTITAIAALELSDEEIADFTEQVNKQTTIPAIDTILAAAQGQAAANQAARQLQEAKDQAIKTINALADLSTEDQATFTSQITNAENQEQVAAITQAAQEKNNQLQAAKALTAAKEAALQEIGKLNLTDEQRTTAQTAIQQADSIDKVNALLEQAREQALANTAAEEAAKQLQAAKDQAVQTVQIMDLTAQQRATTLAAINEAADTTGINKAVQQATIWDKENQAAKTEAEKLATAKQNALIALKDLNLSQTEKDRFSDEITTATTQAEVSAALEKAQKASAANDAAAEAAKQLQAAKDTAVKEIESLDLTSQQSADFKEQVTVATDQTAIDKILNAAKTQAAANQEAKSLAEYKAAAVDQLTQMNLKDQKETFTNKIQQATTKDAVDNILAEAKKVAETNDAADKLAKLKQDLINKLADLNLTTQQKADFTSQMQAAKDATQLNTIYAAAETQADENTTAEALNKAKEAALAKLKQMNLKDQKDSFITQIKEAKTSSAIDKTLTAAQKVSDKNDADDAIDKVKEAAIQKVQEMTRLTSTQKMTFTSQIRRALTEAEINKVLDAASKADAVTSYVVDYQTIDKNSVKDAANSYIKTMNKSSENPDYQKYESLDDLLAKNTDKGKETYDRIYQAIENDLDYRISESDYVHLQTYFDLNQRYTERMIENMNSYRGMLGLKPIEYVEPSMRSKAYMLSKTIAETIIGDHTLGLGYFLNEWSDAGHKTSSAGQIHGSGLNLVIHSLSKTPMTVETMADFMFKKILSESTAYVTGVGESGHLRYVLAGDSAAFGGLLITGIEQKGTSISGYINKYTFTCVEIIGRSK